jgi:hypothetical protein
MNLPADLDRLPFDLWRSHQYPRRPEIIERAAEEYHRNAPMPQMSLPQRMAFTRWKTPPWVLGWGSNVTALLEAVTEPQQFAARLAAVGQGPAPSESMRQASLARSRLPQPSDNASPELDSTEALPRNVLPQYRVSMTTSDLSAVAEQHQKQETANDANRLAQRDRAIQEVGELTQAMSSLYESSGGSDDVPWFLEV